MNPEQWCDEYSEPLYITEGVGDDEWLEGHEKSCSNK